MSSYSSLVLAHASLRAYWRLGESSGNFADAGPNALTATAAGSGITYSATGAIANDADTAVTFDGSSDAATRADNNALDLGDGPFSIEVWVKRGTTGSAQGLVSKPVSGANGYLLQVDAANVVALGAVGSAPVAFSSTTITDTTAWHHLVVTKNGTARKVYIDGADVTTLGTNATLADNTGTFRLGHQAVATNRYNGSLDEVAIYGAVLSPEEVRQHYDTGKGTRAEADSVTVSDSRTSAPVKAVADSVTASDAQTETVGKTQADSVTVTDAETASAGKALSDSVTVSDALTTAEENALTLGDSASVSDSQSLSTGKPLGDSVTVSDDLTSVSGIEHTETVADSVTVTDDLTTDLTEGTVPAGGGGWIAPSRRLRRAHQLDLVDLVLVSDDLEVEVQADPDLQLEEELLLALV